eukprot:TRINITY_DN3318_c0_g1_i1.p1 TRINITY_DN3318_c0_g1~~TRINITY_DN3318_c0_g1_i1.p1  ORF type:complete len:163 (-),score=61.30 TRINITY_DN3318_c0_g1_i1:24-512(-)
MSELEDLELARNIIESYSEKSNTSINNFNLILSAQVQVQKVDRANKSIVYSFNATKDLQNAFGTLHGGAVATLIDELTTLTLMLFDKDSRAGVSVDINVQYINAIPTGTQVFLTSNCVKIGKRLAFLEAIITDTKGKIFMKGTHIKCVDNLVPDSTTIQAKL